MENPETNFEKVYSLQPEVPAKEYRNLIQSMCENFQFEKNIIKKTASITIPPEVRSDIKRRKTFQNYIAIKDYAKFKQSKDHFASRKFPQSSSSLSRQPGPASPSLSKGGQPKRYESHNKNSHTRAKT